MQSFQWEEPNNKVCNMSDGESALEKLKLAMGYRMGVLCRVYAILERWWEMNFLIGVFEQRPRAGKQALSVWTNISDKGL